MHLTTVYSKAIVKAYYGKKQKSSYWIGCSSGGKQGLKELQTSPDSFDGVIAGAAACVLPAFTLCLRADDYGPPQSMVDSRTRPARLPRPARTAR
mgnify:CR=1 FL=1